MKDLIEYINEAKEITGSDSKAFFKAWKKMRNIGVKNEEIYNIVDKWVEQFNLTLLPEGKIEKPTNQPILTLLISKKKEHYALDIAVTRPGKKTEIEGLGSINLIEDTWLNSIEDYDKWRKEYRGITTLQFAFPHGFFDKIRANLGDKLA